MFARLSTVALLALPLLASATAIVSRGGGAACATGTTQCCESVQDPSSSGIKTLLGTLGIPIDSVTADVGVTCSPISVIGVGGTSCATQTVCCQNNNFNGVVALGCTPINVGL